MTSAVLAPAAPTPQLRRARVAVALSFVTNGMLVGSWAPRIPDVQRHLGLSTGALGVALLGPALGMILIARPIGAATARYGSPRVTVVASLIFCALAWVPGVAPNLGLLALSLLVWGMAMGTQDVAMNSQGVTVELGYGRPVLAGFHAMWSVGTFLGALEASIAITIGAPVAAQQAVIGAVLAVGCVLGGRLFVPDPPHEAAPTVAPRIRRPKAPDIRLVLLGIAAAFAMLSEGSVSDWSSLLLRNHLHVTGGRISLAYIAFTICMTSGRFLGDRVVHALGRTRCLTGLAILGAAGLGIGLATNSLAGAVVGFALLGIGLSVMVPVLFSTAADTNGPSGPAIAAVSGIGYVGMIAGPSVIGFVSQATGLFGALFMIVPFTLVAGGLGISGVRLTARRKTARAARTARAAA